MQHHASTVMTFAFVLLTLTLMTFNSVDGCSTSDPPEDATDGSFSALTELLCYTALVFRGRIESNYTIYLDDTTQVTTTFRVVEYFRDTTKEQSLYLDIVVDYENDFLCCRPEPFDFQAESILVFAESFDGSHFVFPCVASPAWQDVNQKFKDTISFGDPCGEANPTEDPHGGSLTTRTTTSTPESSSGSIPTTSPDQGHPTLTLWPMTSEVACPIAGQHRVTIKAEVDLRGVDTSTVLMAVDFLVEDATSKQVCRANLSSCPGQQTQMCYCYQRSEFAYLVRMTMISDLSYIGAQVRVVVKDKNDSSIVASSNTTRYPEIRGPITETLRAGYNEFKVNGNNRMIDISQWKEVGVIPMTYDVRGLTPPYSVSVTSIPNFMPSVANGNTSASLMVDLYYDGVTLAYRETGGPCARNASRNLIFEDTEGRASNVEVSLITTSLLILATVILQFFPR